MYAIVTWTDLLECTAASDDEVWPEEVHRALLCSFRQLPVEIVQGLLGYQVECGVVLVGELSMEVMIYANTNHILMHREANFSECMPGICQLRPYTTGAHLVVRKCIQL